MEKKIFHKRKGLTKEQRNEVFKKTGGRCHICGVKLTDKWCADHIVPHITGGKNDSDNCLPACWACNRLRWFFYKPEAIQKIMRLGTYANTEINSGSQLGLAIDRLYKKQLEKNERRRNMQKGSGE